MILLFVLLSWLPAARASDPEPDKFLHYTVSVAIAASVADVSRRYGSRNPELDGFLLAFALGLAKECADPEFSEGDLLADALGSATPLLLHWEF